MLPLEHSAILLSPIKLPFVIKIFVLSIFEWPLKTGNRFTVLNDLCTGDCKKCALENSEHPDKMSQKSAFHHGRHCLLR